MQGCRIRVWVVGSIALCAVTIAGCAAPVLPSQRIYDPTVAQTLGGPVPITGHRFGIQDPAECTSCQDRQRLQDYVACAQPYVSGPFMHHGSASGYAAEQPTIRPPHSKFHPVPTRPVFRTRASYLPPQPIGVHLVPVPDHGLQTLMPVLEQPHSTLTLPPNPPLEGYDAARLNEYGGADGFMLPPPGN